MSGFLAPSAGTVTLDGEPVWRHTEAYRTIGLVPERELSFGYLTGRQFVLANAELHGLADPGAATERPSTSSRWATPPTRRSAPTPRACASGSARLGAGARPVGAAARRAVQRRRPAPAAAPDGAAAAMGAEGRTVLFSSHILEEVEQVARQIEVSSPAGTRPRATSARSAG